MDHQPFETRILEPNHPSPLDAREFQQHLEQCASCRALQNNWLAAEQTLKRTPQLSPRPGFSTRWQASLAERRARQHVRQVRILLLTLSGGSLVSLLGLIAVFLTVAKPVDLLVAGTRVITTFNGLLVSIQSLFTGALASPLPMAIWIALGCGFCLLVTTWVITLWRISYKGVTVQ